MLLNLSLPVEVSSSFVARPSTSLPLPPPPLGLQVVVLGASGLLGRGVMKELVEGAYGRESLEVLGTVFSRTGPGLVRVDASDAAAVREFLERERPG
jgi:hypothetical protein